MNKRIVSLLLSMALTTPGVVLLEQGKLRADSGEPAQEVAEDVQIAIDQTNFPDEHFRDYVLDEIDYAAPYGVLTAEEIADAEIISCNEDEIKSLKGIEYFTALEDLRCYGNALRELDLTSNVNLVHLECDYNEDEFSVNLSGLSKLEYVELDRSELSSVNLSGCVALKELDVYYCPGLSELNVSDCKALEDLDCSECYSLTSLDLSNLVNLTQVYCYDSPITELKFRNNLKLTKLIADNIPLRELELYACPYMMALLDAEPEPEKDDYKDNRDLTLYYLEIEARVRTENGDTVTCTLDYDENDVFITEAPIFGVSVTTEGSGTASVSVNRGVEGTAVTLTATPNNGCFFSEWKIVSGNAVISNPTSATTTLIIGDSDVTVKAVFRNPSFEDFIERMYVVALNRASEPEGKAFWMDKVKNEGFTGGRVAIGFLIEAPEFLNRGLSDSDFIDVLYRTFFDRDADEGGKSFWLGHLSSDMTREQVVRGFIDSTEWCNLCAFYGVKSGAPNAKAEKPSDNALKFATRLYTECLGRQPDADGLAFWALRLTNLESSGYEAAKGFFESAEFMGKNVDDATYVKLLYRTFMGRDYDQSGLEFWLGHLATDMNRLQVLQGFAQSQEFTNICNSYGIDRGTI